jgi:octaprenyl-diphosphate synthase
MLTKTLQLDESFKPNVYENPLFLIQDKIKLVESKMRNPPPDQQKWLIDESYRLFNAGGKRIRPAISLLISEMLSNDVEKSISLAAGIEMLHTATLVHDDIIDKADTRRGITTTSSAWSNEVAILMGDYLFARAADLVSKTDNIRIMQLFAQTLMIILNGEIAQQATRWIIDREEYYQRIYAKTAAVFVLSAQASAVLGGISSEKEQSFIEFGKSSGMAFQIIDDILDYTSSPDVLGKPSGGDLNQGLFTLPAIYYFEDNPDDPDLRSLLNGHKNKADIVERLVYKINKSNAIQSAHQEAKEFIATAHQQLSSFSRTNYTHSLFTLIESIADRIN